MSDKLDALLAEYKGLRAEQCARVSSQSSFIAPLVAVLILAGSWQAGLRPWIPLLVLPMALAHSSHRFWINHIAEYVREHLWPAINRETHSTISWETFTEQVMWNSRARVMVMVAGEAGLTFLMVLFSIAMVVVSWPFHPLLVVADIVAIVLTAVWLPITPLVNRNPVEDISWEDPASTEIRDLPDPDKQASRPSENETGAPVEVSPELGTQ